MQDSYSGNKYTFMAKEYLNSLTLKLEYSSTCHAGALLDMEKNVDSSYTICTEYSERKHDRDHQTASDFLTMSQIFTSMVVFSHR